MRRLMAMTIAGCLRARHHPRRSKGTASRQEPYGTSTDDLDTDIQVVRQAFGQPAARVSSEGSRPAEDLPRGTDASADDLHSLALVQTTVDEMLTSKRFQHPDLVKPAIQWVLDELRSEWPVDGDYCWIGATAGGANQVKLWLPEPLKERMRDRAIDSRVPGSTARAIEIAMNHSGGDAWKRTMDFIRLIFQPSAARLSVPESRVLMGAFRKVGEEGQGAALDGAGLATRLDDFHQPEEAFIDARSPLWHAFESFVRIVLEDATASVRVANRKEIQVQLRDGDGAAQRRSRLVVMPSPRLSHSPSCP